MAWPSAFLLVPSQTIHIWRQKQGCACVGDESVPRQVRRGVFVLNLPRAPPKGGHAFEFAAPGFTKSSGTRPEKLPSRLFAKPVLADTFARFLHCIARHAFFFLLVFFFFFFVLGGFCRLLGCALFAFACVCCVFSFCFLLLLLLLFLRALNSSYLPHSAVCFTDSAVAVLTHPPLQPGSVWLCSCSFVSHSKHQKGFICVF